MQPEKQRQTGKTYMLPTTTDEKSMKTPHTETQEPKPAKELSSSAKMLVKEAISDLTANPAAAKLTEALSKLARDKP